MDFDNFDISLGIRKKRKLVNIKKIKVNKTQKLKDLNKILENHKKNTEKLKNENKKLENKIAMLSNNSSGFFDFNDLDIESYSENSTILSNEYDIDNITFTEKNKISDKKESVKNDKIFTKLKKLVILDLKKYFKKKDFDSYNKIINIGNEQNKTEYDTLILDYDNTLFINEYCDLLKFTTDKKNILLDYFSSNLFDNTLIKKINISKFENSYKSIKMIAEYLNFDIVLLNEDLEMVDELYSKTKKKLYFLLANNKIYAIDSNFNKFYKFKIHIKKSITTCLSRDIEKNSKFVLFEELDDYEDYYIHFPKIKYSIFKYQYLLNNLYLTKIGDLTKEQLDIIKYLVKNFGLHFNLLREKKYINKKDFTLDFINNHLNYSIDNISLFDYKYYNKLDNINELVRQDKYKKYEDFNYYYSYKNNIIQGIDKNEIYNKCLEKFNIKIDLNEIKKIQSYMSLNSIKTQENINTILSLFQNTDTLCIFEDSNKQILSEKKMDFTNPPTFEYILKLHEKIKECKICGCGLTMDKNDKNKISIDAINPLLGHINDNIDLLCGECNILKGTSFMGDYTEKPYFYDIDTLDKNKIIELLNYHKLDISGIIPTLRKRLKNHIKNIDNY